MLEVKSLPVLAVLVLLSQGAAGCGGTHDASVSVATSPTKPGAAGTYFTKSAPVPLPVGQTILGDGDADNPTDTDGDGNNPENVDKGEYADGDGEDDSRTKASYDYPDADDRGLLDYGHVASKSDKRAITEIVRRYYTLAASGDGARACLLILPNLARAIPEDDGRGAGPSYLTGAKTCSAVMSRLFAHFHTQLAAPITVTVVRVEGAQARVIIGSRTLHAGDITLERQGASWKIDELLGNPLP